MLPRDQINHMRGSLTFNIRTLSQGLLAILLLLTVGAAAAGVSGKEPVEELLSPAPLCNFGVNASDPIDLFDTTPLRIGWYLDYFASANPVEPNGAEYVPVIRIHQVGQNGYSYVPDGPVLQAAIAGNPGAAWLVGNEPDSIVQDNLDPHVYAAAYHELYNLIKSADPTARIFAGSIVQPTEVRLIYLDMVLDSYREAYDALMPVDGWSIHNFILNEVDCEAYPNLCWGAFMPPGIPSDILHGEILTVEDHDRMDLFIERINRFRNWMFDRGYHGMPLYLTEYGILMPPDLGNGFPPSRVNAFMNSTFDYLTASADPKLGNPNDDDRLVQKYSWYSTSNAFFNGWLYEPGNPDQLSPMGLNYAAYVAGIDSAIDLYPARIFSEPPAPFSPTDPVTLTLKADVANSGNVITATGPVAVRFYDGDPGNGGVQIGGDQFVSLVGCGDYQTPSVVWTGVVPGAHQVYVVVDPDGQIEESDELNNIASQAVLVATERGFVPRILKKYP